MLLSQKRMSLESLMNKCIKTISQQQIVTLKIVFQIDMLSKFGDLDRSVYDIK